MAATASLTSFSAPTRKPLVQDQVFCFTKIEKGTRGYRQAFSCFSIKRSNTRRKPGLIHASTTPLDITTSTIETDDNTIGFIGIHHVGVICENLERSLEFYCGLLGLETCNLRPNDRLRYRGTWLWVGNQMIHLMELPNPDPVNGRPAHGGEDRHICVSVKNPMRLKEVLENAGIPYTMSKSGRPVIFMRDPDGNALECQPSYMHESPRN